MNNFPNTSYVLQRILEGKRDKLRDQLEEAKRLKENTDRRAIQVSYSMASYGLTKVVDIHL